MTLKNVLDILKQGKELGTVKWIYFEAGFQFHLDFTKNSVEQLLYHCKTDVSVGPYIQSGDAMLSNDARFRKANRKMFRILDRIEGFSI
ncbi:MAG: hypothetical protein JRF37_04050 [Deltaproteobacteria bacterium]|nr:hypothetical protein [Deltaproteobacteria bacterium]